MPHNINHNQCNIIKNFNEFFREKICILNRLNTEGICLALCLAFLREKISIRHNPRFPCYFERFLSMGSEKDTIEEFYFQFNEKTESYNSLLSDSAKKIYRDKELLPYYDVLAVIDQCLLIYAKAEQGFFLPLIQPRMDPNIPEDIHLKKIAAMSIYLTPELFENFFNASDPLSPFQACGKYLCIFSDHAIALNFNIDGSFEYFDPNFNVIHTEYRGLIAQKNIFFEWYCSDKASTGIFFTVYALDSNRIEDNLEEDLLIHNAVKQGINKSTIAYLSKNFKLQDPFWGNIHSKSLCTIYYADSDLTRGYREQVINALKKEIVINSQDPVSLLTTPYAPQKNHSFFIEVLFICHRIGNLTALKELLDAFGGDVLRSCDSLYYSTYLDNLELFNLLLQYTPSDFKFNLQILEEANRRFAYGQRQIAEKILEEIFSGRKEVSDFSFDIFFYLVRNRCYNLLPTIAKHMTLSLDSTYNGETLLEYITENGNDSLFSILEEEDLKWTYLHIKTLLDRDRLEWVIRIFNRPGIMGTFSTNQLQDLFQFAISNESLILIDYLKTQPHFHPQWTLEIVQMLIKGLRSGRLYMLKKLFSLRLIQPILSHPATEPDSSLKTVLSWFKALRSLSGVSEEEGDQKILTRSLQSALQSNNMTALQSLLELPNVIFKPQEIIFESKPLLCHLIMGSYWQDIIQMLPHVIEADGYSKQYFYGHLEQIIKSHSLSNENFLILCKKMNVSIGAFLENNGGAIKKLKKKRRTIFMEIFLQLNVADKEKNIMDLENAFEMHKHTLASKKATVLQICHALEQISLILSVLDLFLDDSIESYSYQKLMISQWQSYLLQGTDSLVQVWTQRKDPTVKKLLAWNPKESKSVMLPQNNQKLNFYSGLKAFIYRSI